VIYIYRERAFGKQPQRSMSNETPFQERYASFATWFAAKHELYADEDAADREVLADRIAQEEAAWTRATLTHPQLAGYKVRGKLVRFMNMAYGDDDKALYDSSSVDFEAMCKF
jgi:hypothetical protein